MYVICIFITKRTSNHTGSKPNASTIGIKRGMVRKRMPSQSIIIPSTMIISIITMIIPSGLTGIAIIIRLVNSIPLAQPPTSTQSPTSKSEPTPTRPKTIMFIDENLEAAVRNALFIERIRVKDEALLNKPLDEEITTAELAKLTKTEAVSRNITDISGLEYCANLTYLNLVENKITDISLLISLTNMITLNLGENQISNISPLSSLTNLTELDLYANNISDISPLVENSGLRAGDLVRLEGNNLELWEGSDDMENIKVLKNRGVVVLHDPLQSTP